MLLPTNAPGSGFLLNTQQHCFQGEGEREEPNCYIFSCSSGMEGSENVKSNLSFSEESEQDLYDGSLRRKGVRSVYLGT